MRQCELWRNGQTDATAMLIHRTGECQRGCRLPFVTIFPILRLIMSVPRRSLRRMFGARHPRDARARQSALCVAPGGCDWSALRGPMPSPPLRFVPWALPGRDGKAGSPIEPESWMCEVAARTMLSRSRLRVTTPTGVQFRVNSL